MTRVRATVYTDQMNHEVPMKTITITMPDALYENFKECSICCKRSLEEMFLLMAEYNIANTDPFLSGKHVTRVAVGERVDKS